MRNSENSISGIARNCKRNGNNAKIVIEVVVVVVVVIVKSNIEKKIGKYK